MLTWIILALILTSLFVTVERVLRGRPNGIGIPPLAAAEILLLIDDVRDGYWIGAGVAVLAMALCAGWAQSLRVARQRRLRAARNS
jgi:hypothetical protein